MKSLRDLPLPLRLAGVWALCVGISIGGFFLFFFLVFFSVAHHAQRAAGGSDPGTPVLAHASGNRIELLTCDCPRRGRRADRRIVELAPHPHDAARLEILSSRPAPEGEPLEGGKEIEFFTTQGVGAPAGILRPFRLAEGRVLLLSLDTAAGRVRIARIDDPAAHGAPRWETAAIGVRNFSYNHFTEAGGRIWRIFDDRDADAILLSVWGASGPEFRIEGSLRDLLPDTDGAVLLVERISRTNSPAAGRLTAVRIGREGPGPETPLAVDTEFPSRTPVYFLHRGALAALTARHARILWSPDALAAAPPRAARTPREVFREPEFRALLPLILLPLLLLLLLPLAALVFARMADRWIAQEVPSELVAGGLRRAPLRKRTLALLADAVVTTTPNLILLFGFVAVLLPSIEGLPPNAPPPPRFFAAYLLGIPTMLLFGLGFPILYGGICESRYGRTIGKLLVGIRVVTSSGKAPNLLPALLRSLLKLLDQSFYYLSTVILIGMTPPGRTLADLAADTYVVEDPHAAENESPA